MDDALLDDDESFKGEEIEDNLDEAALLGLSDDDDYESPSDRKQTQDSRYQNVNEEDILELDIGLDVDSFLQEDIDASRTSEISTRASSVKVVSMSREEEVSDGEDKDKFSILMDDESDEDPDVDHRDRFRSERHAPQSRRTTTDIPESLESVLDSGEKQKAEDFLENERKKKMAMRQQRSDRNNFNHRPGRSNINNRPDVGISHNIHVGPHFGQNIPVSQMRGPDRHQPFSTPPFENRPNFSYQHTNYVDSSVGPHQSDYSRDVFLPPNNRNNKEEFLFEMQFGGHVTMPPRPNTTSSELQRFNDTLSYFNHPVTETRGPPPLQIGNQPPPFWNSLPLPLSQNPLPLPPPPLHHHQMNPTTFVPQGASPLAFSTPPPFTPAPAPVASNFNRPPFQSNVPRHEPFVPPNPNFFLPPNATPSPANQFQNLHRTPPAFSNVQHQNRGMPRFQPKNNSSPSQMHVKKLIKRSSNFAPRKEPVKLQCNNEPIGRPPFTQHKLNSNITEIPLVENLPVRDPRRQPKVVSMKAISPKKAAPAPAPETMEEDAATRELRLKIEEQKKLREQIWKRKEERRRQMAEQRTQELKTRQEDVSQNPNEKSRGEFQGAPQQETLKIPLISQSSKPPETPDIAIPKQKVDLRQRIGLRRNLPGLQITQQPMPKGPRVQIEAPHADEVSKRKFPEASVPQIPAKKQIISMTEEQIVQTSPVKRDIQSRIQQRDDAKHIVPLLKPEIQTRPGSNVQKQNPSTVIREPPPSSIADSSLRMPRFAPDVHRGEFNPLRFESRFRTFQPSYLNSFGSTRQSRMNFFLYDMEQQQSGTYQLNSRYRLIRDRRFQPKQESVETKLEKAETVVESKLEQNRQETQPVIKTEVKADSTQIMKREEKSRKVNVNNLSSSTTETQLKNLCTAIGPIEYIQLEKSQRSAVIVFTNANHALNFQTKYQRYMLDLSLIEVTLQQS